MILSNIIFEVTDSTADDCYAVGDRIVADDIRIIPPEGKGLCSLLLPRLLDIIEKEELQNFNKEDGEFTFSCKGDKKACDGVLQLKVRESMFGDKAVRKNMEQILKLIGNVAFFKNFSAFERRTLLPLLSYKKSPQGTVVIEKDSQPEHAYIILSGAAEVYDGKNKITTLGPGDIFGEMSILGRKKAGASVIVSKTAWIIEIKGGDFQKILTKYPKAQMFLVNVLSRRLAQTSNDRAAEFETVMSGQLAHLPPADLLQMLHSSQKTGTLVLDLSKGKAEVQLWKGELLGLQYDNLVNEEAFYEILQENDGRFRFSPGDDTADRKNDVVASFMGLLLEGLQRIDEKRSGG
jgi:CRP-like cAMP-binding protein